MSHKAPKNSLTIRLTESVVFLKNVDSAGRRPNRTNNASPTSMLRGLLILDLCKPTRISSIELELTGKVLTSWPEGVGSRRVDVTEEHKIFSASTVFFRAPTASSRRPASVGPGLAVYRDDDETQDPPRGRSRGFDTPRNDEMISREHHGLPTRMARHSSVDSSTFQRDFISHREDYASLPTPPYTPGLGSPVPSERNTQRATSSSPFPNISRPEDTPAQTLEEFRNALRAGLEGEQRSTSHNRNGSSRSPMNTSSSSSLHSFREHSLSRWHSIDGVPEDEPMRPQRPEGLTSPPPSPGDLPRGRSKSARFSIAAVSNVILDAVKDQVRSISPRMRTARDGTVSRERGRAASPRGRTLEPKKDQGNLHKISPLGKIGDMLKLDGDDKEAGDGWKEFKKGVYTYPISFMIPGNAPPTIDCAYGHVTWRLKGQVHRPGTFSHKLSTLQEVILIACPGEDDTEDTENIIIERQWDSQLQYLISISGRSFHIGGTLPIQISILPIAKSKVHRIAVILEERTDYYTGMKRIARTDPIRRISLLSLKSDTKEGDSILPLISDGAEAFERSPFYAMLTEEDDPSEMASNLMGPGPWTFHHELALPTSCDEIHFSNKNRKANILISHTLKVVFRVERGDDEFVDKKTGKRKLFDIIVQTPVHILSCRCNPEWTSLPRYSKLLLNESAAAPPSCPCGVKDRARAMNHPSPEIRDSYVRGIYNGLGHVSARQSTETVSTVESSPINRSMMSSLRHGDSLYDRNSQFERLLSGQESEMGEAPPAYDVAARSATLR